MFDRAISLHAPWAWAMMKPAPYGKGVENRSPNFSKKVTGRVWVHASQWPIAGAITLKSKEARRLFISEVEVMLETMWEALGWLTETYDVRDLNQLTELLQQTTEQFGPHVVAQCDALRGRIVGSVEVYGYRTPEDPPESPWYVPGSTAIMVRDPQPLETPVMAKGALGWWKLTSDVLKKLEAVA